MTAWLRCKATRGMFPHEVAVLVLAVDGRSLSFFVPRSEVRLSQEPGDGEVPVALRVEVLAREPGQTIVRLPVEPFEGSRVTRVHDDLLAAA
jgi:hypothetical protein